MATILGLEEIEQENTAVDELETENVNLIFVGVDCSGSMDAFIKNMKSELQAFKTAVAKSKEADEILAARGNFSDTIQIGGYKKISEFDDSYQTYGMTKLYDVIVEGGDKLLQYRDYLRKQGMRVKAVFSIFSDGADTDSKHKLADAKAKITELNKNEIVTAFISFGKDSVKIATDLKFKNVLEVGRSESELRKAFSCLSKSVIENSKSVTNKTDDFFTI
ncbi:MAG TPA: hypothetical protein DHW82_03560 [Spirochaetia bacterium]|nr:MAG: hypothetical protein A2Y41_06350 [Spirochaetes bacterium GWB1_36_13]HCL56070.1 hypothetical protein [Spirochaetia bacterium]